MFRGIQITLRYRNLMILRLKYIKARSIKNVLLLCFVHTNVNIAYNEEINQII